MLSIKKIKIVIQDSSKSTGISGKMEKGLRVFCSHSHNYLGGVKSLSAGIDETLLGSLNKHEFAHASYAKIKFH